MQNKTIRQAIGFAMVGLSNTAVSFGVYYAVLYVAGMRAYIVASLLAGAVSILNAFFWNDRRVFRSEHGSGGALRRVAKTYAAYGSTSLLSTALLHVWVECLSMDPRVAPFVNVLITTPINFMLNKFWVHAQPRGHGKG